MVQILTPISALASILVRGGRERARIFWMHEPGTTHCSDHLHRHHRSRCSLGGNRLGEHVGEWQVMERCACDGYVLRHPRSPLPRLRLPVGLAHAGSVDRVAGALCPVSGQLLCLNVLRGRSNTHGDARGAVVAHGDVLGKRIVASESRSPRAFLIRLAVIGCEYRVALVRGVRSSALTAADDSCRARSPGSRETPAVPKLSK